MDNLQLKVVSWNINGLKSITTPLKELLDSFEADVICFQETKTTRDQLDEATAHVEGYTSYFSFSKRRSGYSGVATFCKDSVRPHAAEEGLSGLLSSAETNDIIGFYGELKDSFGNDVLQSLDAEGRAVMTKHKLKTLNSDTIDLVIINVYCPRADPDRPERKEYKLRFYKLLQHRAEAILKSGSHVLIVGDVNTSHKPIDICEEDDELFYLEPSRIWLNDFLYNPEEKNGGKFVDSFRYFHATTKNAYTVWSTVTNARENNYGHRIDYIFADLVFLQQLMIDSIIMPEVRGSDHCPVAATLRCAAIPANKWPSLCSKNWPEFSGRQSKLSSFVQRLSKNDSAEANVGKHKLDSLKYSRVQQAKQPKLDAFLKVTSTNLNPSQKVMATEEPATSTEEKPKLNDVNNKTTVNAWKSLFKGPPPPPLCKGHKEPSALRMCKKAGQNFKRQFYACARPAGHQNDPNANCNFFQWVNTTKTK